MKISVCYVYGLGKDIVMLYLRLETRDSSLLSLKLPVLSCNMDTAVEVVRNAEKSTASMTDKTWFKGSWSVSA